MQFDWDDGNREKCRKHGVALEDIEHAFRSGARVAPDASHSVVEQRFIALGRSRAGRWLFVAFCWRGDRVRPISARWMHAREAARHGLAQGSGDDDR